MVDTVESAAKKNWAEEEDDHEEGDDVVIGQEQHVAKVEEVKVEAVPEAPKPFIKPVVGVRNKYGDFVVSTIVIKDKVIEKNAAQS